MIFEFLKFRMVTTKNQIFKIFLHLSPFSILKIWFFVVTILNFRNSRTRKENKSDAASTKFGSQKSIDSSVEFKKKILKGSIKSNLVDPLPRPESPTKKTINVFRHGPNACDQTSQDQKSRNWGWIMRLWGKLTAYVI